jgi:cobalt/nickel transport system permease protein
MNTFYVIVIHGASVLFCPEARARNILFRQESCMSAQEIPTTRKRLGTYYLFLILWLFTSAMHIPDGYLSPVTSLIMFLLVLPFWGMGVRKIRQTMNARSVPLISLMAAFSFVIMMFNIPLPGGTTGHAVGAALAAIVLGPEIAAIAISIALIIQAFFFGDGGILAIGANCFNMGVVMPYVASAVYQSFAKGTQTSSPRRLVGAAVGGWLGLTAAAFFTAVEFGLQPLLFTAADGTPLYAPYPLPVSLPAMLIPHMVVASTVEGMMTALIVLYLQRSNAQVLEGAGKTGGFEEGVSMRKLRWLWVGLAVLVAASPLGLLAPGTAWGEWGIEELAKLGLQSIPAGLEKLSSLWGAPLAEYNLPALGNANVGYMLSAFLGIVLVGMLVWLLTLLATGDSARQKERM